MGRGTMGRLGTFRGQPFYKYVTIGSFTQHSSTIEYKSIGPNMRSQCTG